MESSMSHLQRLCNLAQSFGAGRGSSLRAFHLLSTRREGRCHIGCEKNLAVGRRSGERNEAGYGLCKFQRHGGSKPNFKVRTVSVYL